MLRTTLLTSLAKSSPPMASPRPRQAVGGAAYATSWTGSPSLSFRQRSGKTGDSSEQQRVLSPTEVPAEKRTGARNQTGTLGARSAVRLGLALAIAALILWRTVYWSVKEPLRIRESVDSSVDSSQKPELITKLNSETRLAHPPLPPPRLFGSSYPPGDVARRSCCQGVWSCHHGRPRRDAHGTFDRSDRGRPAPHLGHPPSLLLPALFTSSASYPTRHQA